ncbi:MAG: SGNH/GDSL hydrolase family protein [Clostridia bacterium]|nr:SGNH/GDSL hydrolase family protein [Clostridia bacterium]
MKKKHFLVSLRNFLIVLLVITLALFGCELIFSLNNKKDEKFFAVSKENQNVLYLQIEKTPISKLLASATNVYNSKNVLDLDLDFVETEKTYPLIDDLTKETRLKDALDIVVIGDSFVWGAYSLNRNELFWRVLENDLRKSGIRANVHAVAATGANAYEELSWLTETKLVEELNPDLVIFGYVYNDSDPSVDIDGESVDWNEELPFLSSIGKIFPNLFNALIQRITSKTMYNNKYSNSNYVNLDGAPPVLKGEFYEKYKADFVKKLDLFAEKVDFPVVVMTLPTLPNNMMIEALFSPLNELYQNCTNIGFYNCIDEFNKFASSAHKNNYSVNVADFHPGSATNKFYSDYIKKVLSHDYSQIIKEEYKKYVPDKAISINEYLPYNISLRKLQENKALHKYSLTYPSQEEEYSVYGIDVSQYYLVEPLGKPHIKLSFSNSLRLSEVNVEGDYESLDLYYTAINEKLGYDDHSVYEFEKKSSASFSDSSDKRITSVLISAEFKEGSDRNLILSFKEAEGQTNE